MKHFLLIAMFTLGVSLLYTGIGQLLPQLENRPPPEVKAGSSISPDELSEAGAVIFGVLGLVGNAVGLVRGERR